MNLAWKEMKKNKLKFFILGSIVFLVSLLTFVISGLANGLSEDNASLIRNMPEGQFLMSSDAEETYSMSVIDPGLRDQVISEHGGYAMSLQMGFLTDDEDRQTGVTFVHSGDHQVSNGRIILDESLQKDYQTGDHLTHEQSGTTFTVAGFVPQAKFSHAPSAFLSADDAEQITRTKASQLIFVPGSDELSVSGLTAFSKSEFLNTIPSYNAEQLSLNMIVWFLIAISGMLFGIFFYMMNVQKIGLYGILKGLGVKTRDLFRMMWTQLIIITLIALTASLSIGFSLNAVSPGDLPYLLAPATAFQLSAVFTLVGFFGATLSGVQIKRIEPLQAIRQGEV
ncbi:FtsX-like permease family protein [Jeotgalibacillus alimentarius]|nr:ABC transporter permease [Jeotgalibacillus alimentarius]